MVELFDRFFSDNLALDASHVQYVTFSATPRITVQLFSDDPCYLAILYVDGVAVLKESFIEDMGEYIDQTRENSNLHSFLLEFATDHL